MRKTVFSLVIILLSLSSIAGEKEKFTINNTKSKIEWVGRKVTGSHEGEISIKKGSIIVEEAKLVSADLIIDMNSIIITDIDDESSNKKLMDVFTSESFFDVEHHPLSKLEITTITYSKDNNYSFKGKLTIKGIQKAIEFPAKVIKDGNQLTVTGELEIDRTDFNIKYGSGSFFDSIGDKAIKDFFLIKFKIQAMN